MACRGLWLAAALVLSLPARAQDAARPERSDPAGVAAETEAPPAATPPRLIQTVEVSLPPGVVPPPEGIELELLIDVRGAVVEAVVLQSLGAEADARISAAAKEMRFAPARRGDEPIAARVRFRFAVEAPAAGEQGLATSGASAETVAADAAPASAADIAQGEAAEAGARSASAHERLRPRPADEPEFGAVARVDRPEPGAASQVKLRGAELTNVPGTFGEPLRVVATLPGVARTPFGLGFFVVRGASFQNTGFLVDGFPVPLLYHLGAGPAIFSSRLVDKLDFYPGGYPVAYGRYNAGIISLHTAPPPTDRAQLEFEVDLLRASALAVVPFDEGKGSVAAAFRRSYFELILPLITDDVSLAYTDYQLRLDYRFSDSLRTWVFFFGSRDSLEVTQLAGSGSTTADAQTGLQYNFDQVIAGLEYRVSAPVRVRWSGTFGPSGADFGQESVTNAALGADLTSLRLGQRLELIAAPSDLWRTTLGVEESIWITEVSGNAPSFAEWPAIPAPQNDRDSIALEDRVSELAVAPYLEQVVHPGPFTLTAGLRAEYLHYGDVRTWQLDPRGVVRYRASDALTFKAASGLFGQPPLPPQLVRRYANPKLRPNRSWQSSLGGELTLPWSLEVDSTLFYSRMWQLARASGLRELDTEGDPIASIFRDDGEGRAYGLELLLRRRDNEAGASDPYSAQGEGLFGWLSYTLSRSERFLEGGDAVPFFFDQTHVLNLALSYGLGDLRFGARFTLATGRPVNDFRANDDNSNVFYDADADDYDPDDRGRRVRLPTFHQLDVRIDYLFAWGPLEGGVFLDVINVYAANNAEGYFYEYDLSRRGRVPGIPTLPTIGVRGVFR